MGVKKNIKEEIKMFKFDEPQGRLELRISCYLEQDLTNEELEKLFNEVKIKIKHKLIADVDVSALTKAT